MGWVYVKKKKVPGQPGHWNEAKKIEALTAFFQSGSYAIASGISKVPECTTKNWRRSDWGREFEQNLNDQDNQELDAKMSKIIKKTLEVLEDRLDHGNFQFDQRTGKLVRVPVSIGDTHKVMSDLVNHRRVIRHEPTTISEKKETSDDRLLKLAEQFAKLANGKKEDPINGAIIEGSVTQEQWEASTS